MTKTKHIFLSFDVGERRIGVAQADSDVRIAFPLATIEVDGSEYGQIQKLVAETGPTALVVGYPRNQQGEATAQTAYVESVAKHLEAYGVPVVFQDESLTSVLAEQYLQQTKKPYTKGDIDARAAAIILGDYIEATYGY